MTVSAPQIGKSLTIGAWLLASAWMDAGSIPWRSWWAAPTIAQANEGFARYVVTPAREAGILAHSTESSPVRAWLTNGSVLEARSWERSGGLYGPTVARIAVDEFGLLDEDAWAALSSRTTETAIHGYGHIRMAGNVSEIGGIAEKLYQTAMSGKPGWIARTWTWRHRSAAAACECGLNGEGTEIEFADLHDLRCERGIYLRTLADRQAVMSPMHFRQLYEAEWIDYSALPVYTFERAVHVREDVRLDRFLPLELACDFNVDPMAWVIGQHKGHEIWAADEIAIEGGTNTQQAIDEFVRRYPEWKAGVVVYGDASGQSRKTSASRTDYDIIRAALEGRYTNVSFRVPAANPPIVDRVNAVNALLKSAAGQVRYTLHPRCARLADDLARVSWKKGTRDIDSSDKRLTHFSSADGYRLVSLFPVGQGETVAYSVASDPSYVGDLMSRAF